MPYLYCCLISQLLTKSLDILGYAQIVPCGGLTGSAVDSTGLCVPSYLIDVVLNYFMISYSSPELLVPKYTDPSCTEVDNTAITTTTVYPRYYFGDSCSHSVGYMFYPDNFCDATSLSSLFLTEHALVRIDWKEVQTMHLKSDRNCLNNMGMSWIIVCMILCICRKYCADRV